jgi:hypothetical protein
MTPIGLILFSRMYSSDTFIMIAKEKLLKIFIVLTLPAFALGAYIDYATDDLGWFIATPVLLWIVYWMYVSKAFKK